jgi:DivIVA domain-containing protein
MARKKKDRGSETPDQVEAAPGPGSPPEPSTGLKKRISPVDIQHKEFRLAFRGYNERDVDAFLDEITEEIARLHAETKRLRDQGDQGTAPLQTAAPAEAEALLRRARDEAARTVADAQARAAAIQAQARTAAAAGAAAGAGSTAGPPMGLARTKVPISAFLAREREFLQGLAGLIQSHADAVKDDVRKAREVIARAAEPEPAGAARPEQASTPEAPAAVEEPATPEASVDAGPPPATELSRAETMAFEAYPDEDTAGSASPEATPTPWAQDPDEPWRPPVPQDAGGRAGQEGQGPAGDDEGSPWRSEAGSTFGPGAGVHRAGLVDLTAQERRGDVEGGATGAGADEPAPEREETGVKPPRSEPVTDRGAPPELEGGTEGEDRSLRELFWGQD